MNSSDSPVAEIPLVETAPGSPIHELFGSVSDAEEADVFRSIWGDFRGDLIPRLEALGSFTDAELLRRELHTLRGTSAQFGLFLLEVYLFAWEKKTPDPVAAAPRFLPGSLAIAVRSLEAIEHDFPFLDLPGSTHA